MSLEAVGMGVLVSRISGGCSSAFVALTMEGVATLPFHRSLTNVPDDGRTTKPKGFMASLVRGSGTTRGAAKRTAPKTGRRQSKRL